MGDPKSEGRSQKAEMDPVKSAFIGGEETMADGEWRMEDGS